MTRPTFLVDSIEQRITITIDADFFYLLDVSTGATFLPELVATPRVVVGEERPEQSMYLGYTTFSGTTRLSVI
ncbi:hypothetical protein C462_12200 [Halorubrum distributum JCM 13916]|uniref:Uncharacterized protein n=1 Tax=Halorubrum distributum JCM 13916 TaxID=1230455 RepID=M0PJ38_9EURY|nr:hypothetical protein C462_12200 [Halorubrum arcis JCM 13916]